MTQLSDAVDAIFQPALEAIEAARIPGAAFGMIHRDGTQEVRWAGHAQIEPQLIALQRTTWFDLASLTKVIFTTHRLLSLVDQGRFSLDDPLAKHIPDLRQYDLSAPERRLTIRELLAHQTHLPAVEPLYTLGQEPETLKAYVLQRIWQSGPPVYSDINYILLGILIERLTGLALNEQPLGVGLSFSPPAEASAATEQCAWRGRVVRGEVHDENAYALGGAAGHAGLFGTVDGVLTYAHTLLRGKGLSGESLAAIATVVSGTRALGWEIVHHGWHGGEGHSRRTIGHLGFTGTGLWIDLDRGIAWTLLTNRVHPSRHTDTGIMALRRETGTRVARFTASL
jgi:CubicO group peptidase (beta-lactamase class C family)